MSPEPQQPDDEFATRLEACDELLRTGDVSGSSILPTLASSEEMRDRLERGLDCVKRLKKLFPGQSSAGRGSRSRSHRGKQSWGEMPSSIGRFQIQRELGR